MIFMVMIWAFGSFVFVYHAVVRLAVSDLAFLLYLSRIKAVSNALIRVQVCLKKTTTKKQGLVHFRPKHAVCCVLPVINKCFEGGRRIKVIIYCKH